MTASRVGHDLLRCQLPACGRAAKPIVGVVRDKDTGKPLAGVDDPRATSWPADPIPGIDIVQTTTDAAGPYRLTGDAQGQGQQDPARAGRRPAVPERSRPHVPDSPGLDPVTVDFELKRGIWIEGKITDKVTGKPVQGHLSISRSRTTLTCATTPVSTARSRRTGRLTRKRTVPTGSLDCPVRA